MMHERISTPIGGNASHLPAIPLSAFDTQLRRPLRMEPAGELELTPYRAFEILVSAACYLSLSSSTNVAATLDAVQLLHTASQALAADGAEFECVETEDLIWRGKQLRWERHCLRESLSAL